MFTGLYARVEYLCVILVIASMYPQYPECSRTNKETALRDVMKMKNVSFHEVRDCINYLDQTPLSFSSKDLQPAEIYRPTVAVVSDLGLPDRVSMSVG
jgi:hypothetical protein